MPQSAHHVATHGVLPRVWCSQQRQLVQLFESSDGRHLKPLTEELHARRNERECCLVVFHPRFHLRFGLLEPNVHVDEDASTLDTNAPDDELVDGKLPVATDIQMFEERVTVRKVDAHESEGDLHIVAFYLFEKVLQVYGASTELVHFEKHARQSFQLHLRFIQLLVHAQVLVHSCRLHGVVDKDRVNHIHHSQHGEDDEHNEQDGVAPRDDEEQPQDVPVVDTTRDRHEERENGHRERPKEHLHRVHVLVVRGRVGDVLDDTVEKDDREEKHFEYQHNDGPHQHGPGTQDRHHHEAKLPNEGDVADEPEHAQGGQHPSEPQHPEDVQVEPHGQQRHLENRQTHDRSVKNVPLPVLPQTEPSFECQDAGHQFNEEHAVEPSVDSKPPPRLRCVGVGAGARDRVIALDDAPDRDVARDANEECIQKDERDDANFELGIFHELLDVTQGQHAPGREPRLKVLRFRLPPLQHVVDALTEASSAPHHLLCVLVVLPQRRRTPKIRLVVVVAHSLF
mmetsp:Transcript_15328/g.41974  ORF Transcript_15328/g.41974 Transcript_15328/m.41974 type:complete len:511 (+) Transcript_15328:138-1670(+)